ncbi:MAG: flagellar hook assembly protein FlgD [Polaromonas sp.]|jgi:flagellar basal-body rod modification protein FlgD
MALNTTSVASLSATQALSSTAAAKNTGAESQDRFLKLLVAQLNNQDPMNPMDNAQMTTQMAQINTVTGIEQVNRSIKDLASQMSAMQNMAGAQMIGRDVLVEANALTLDGAGNARGTFALSGSADTVKVEVISSGGQLLDTQSLGAISAGQHDFGFSSASLPEGARFRIRASQSGAAVAATELSVGRVVSVSTDAANVLQLQLQNGSKVAYSQLKSIY